MGVLTGKRILVVEDDEIVAMVLEDMLADLGAEPVGPANTLEKAMASASDGKFHAAILDLNLNGERTSGVARVLRGRGVPFILSTGYAGDDGEMAGYSSLLQKPYDLGQVAKALEDALGEDDVPLARGA